MQSNLSGMVTRFAMVTPDLEIATIHQIHEIVFCGLLAIWDDSIAARIVCLNLEGILLEDG